MSVPLTTLLGETVQAKDGRVTKLVSELVGEEKVVGLYFSNVSSAFTSKLITWYNDFKETENGSKFEIVMVSSDYCRVDFDEQDSKCYPEIPWLTLDYEKQDKKAALLRKFRVMSDDSDMLVLLNALTGRVITRNGRAIVSEDPSGKYFPWTSKSFLDIMKDITLIPADPRRPGMISWDDIEGTHVGIYYSAHWCRPCEAFTFQLDQTYKTINAGVKRLEIIFVSSDKTEAAFRKYCRDMPWLALMFKDGKKKILTRILKVTKVPTLIIFDKITGEMITRNGTGAIWGDTAGLQFPWYPKPVQELMKYLTFTIINEQPVLIWVTGHDYKEESKKACDIMTPIATEYQKEVGHLELHEKLAFLYSKPTTEEVSRIRDLFKLPEDKTSFLCVTNAPEQATYICKEENITADVVRRVVEEIKTNRLAWEPVLSQD